MKINQSLTLLFPWNSRDSLHHLNPSLTSASLRPRPELGLALRGIQDTGIGFLGADRLSATSIAVTHVRGRAVDVDTLVEAHAGLDTHRRACRGGRCRRGRVGGPFVGGVKGGQVACADAVAVCSAAVEAGWEELLQTAGDDEVYAEVGLFGYQDGEEEGGEVAVFHAVAVQVDDGGCGEGTQPGEELQALQ